MGWPQVLLEACGSQWQLAETAYFAAVRQFPQLQLSLQTTLMQVYGRCGMSDMVQKLVCPYVARLLLLVRCHCDCPFMRYQLSTASDMARPDGTCRISLRCSRRRTARTMR